MIKLLTYSEIMKTNHNNETILETSILGFRSIFKIVGYKKILFSNWINILPIFFAFITALICCFLKINTYCIIQEIIKAMISFLPGILGFTVAGYSFMIGLIHANMLNKITEPINKNNKFSLYQKTSATFAASIMIQAIALVYAYICHFFIFFDKEKNIYFPIENIFISGINLIILLISSYFFIISLLMIIQVVINIFNFSQLHHYFVNKAKIEQA